MGVLQNSNGGDFELAGADYDLRLSVIRGKDRRQLTADLPRLPAAGGRTQEKLVGIADLHHILVGAVKRGEKTLAVDVRLRHANAVIRDMGSKK